MIKLALFSMLTAVVKPFGLKPVLHRLTYVTGEKAGFAVMMAGRTRLSLRRP